MRDCRNGPCDVLELRRQERTHKKEGPRVRIHSVANLGVVTAATLLAASLLSTPLTHASSGQGCCTVQGTITSKYIPLNAFAYLQAFWEPAISASIQVGAARYTAYSPPTLTDYSIELPTSGPWLIAADYIGSASGANKIVSIHLTAPVTTINFTLPSITHPPIVLTNPPTPTTLQGSDFTPNTTLNLYSGTFPGTLLGAVKVDSNGTFTFPTTAPGPFSAYQTTNEYPASTVQQEP